MEEIRLSDHFGYKKLIRFTLPTIAMMICTSVYGVIDGLFISNIVGSTAFAAVNLIWPVVMILGAIGIMTGTGGAALVAKTLGEGREKLANECFSMLVYFVFMVGVILAVAGILFLPQISAFIGAEGELLDGCITYGTILLIALPAFMLQCTFQSFLIVAERPKLGFVVSIACGIANMAMDFIAIYLLRGGLRGAGMATAVSELVGALIPLVFFLRRNGTCLHLVRTGFNFSAILQANMNGASEMVSGVAVNVVSILYNYQLLRFIGADGVVAYGVIAYVAFIFNGVYGGYATGVGPIISYHYGAQNKEEMHNLLMRSLKLIAVISLTMALTSELLAGLQAGIFVSYDRELMAFTTRAIRIYSLSYFISGFNIFASSFFTALNNGAVSALISFLRTFVFLAAAVLIMPAILGINGIWLAVVAAELLSLIVSALCVGIGRSRYGY